MSTCYLEKFRKCPGLENVLRKSDSFFSTCKAQESVIRFLSSTKNLPYQEPILVQSLPYYVLLGKLVFLSKIQFHL